MDEDVIASMTETLLRDRPNTYCLTKAVTEEYLFKHAKDIPLGIFRPSIIGASWQEPAPVSTVTRWLLLTRWLLGGY